MIISLFDPFYSMMPSKIYNTAMLHFHLLHLAGFFRNYPHTPSIELHACGGFSNWIPVGAPKTSSASLPGSAWFHIASVSSFYLPIYGRSKSLEPLSFLIKCFCQFRKNAKICRIFWKVYENLKPMDLNHIVHGPTRANAWREIALP